MSTAIFPLSCQRSLYLLLPLKFKLDRGSLETIYKSFILPVLEYAHVVWGGIYDCDLTKIEQIHIDTMRLVTGPTARCNIVELYTESGWQSISTRLDNANYFYFLRFRITLRQINLFLFCHREIKKCHCIT